MTDTTQNFSTRVPKDTAEELEGYIETKGLSKSEGIRKLATSGLDYERWGGRDHRERVERELAELKEENKQLNERVDDFRRTHAHPGDDIAQQSVWVVMFLIGAAIATNVFWDFGETLVAPGDLLLLALLVGVFTVVVKVATFILKVTGWRISPHIPNVDAGPMNTENVEDPVQK